MVGLATDGEALLFPLSRSLCRCRLHQQHLHVNLDDIGFVNANALRVHEKDTAIMPRKSSEILEFRFFTFLLYFTGAISLLLLNAE